jgi:hypothetical protein
MGVHLYFGILTKKYKLGGTFCEHSGQWAPLPVNLFCLPSSGSSSATLCIALKNVAHRMQLEVPNSTLVSYKVKLK